MSNKAKLEYLQEIRKRYFIITRKEKTLVLDEFCAVCKYNRKYAVRLINKKEDLTAKQKKKGRRSKYNKKPIIDFLKDLWISTNLACSIRLKAAIPLWISYYTLHSKNTLSKEDTQLLLLISPRTIDRLLKRLKHKHKKSGLSTTKPGSLLKKQIPISVNQWDQSRPGYLEADTVAHCGTSVAGQYVFSVDIVDLATGWTEQRAVWGKGQRGMLEALKSIQEMLPFKILGFDSDNGSEFLNYHIYNFFTNRKHPVNYTRSRPYIKNDNAHIEEKNWTHIRQYLGYMRFDNPEITSMLNEMYTSEWRFFQNFFIPSSKLIEKKRVGAKIYKVYAIPKTPLQRLLDSAFTKPKVKTELKNIFKQLDPYVLHKNLKDKIKLILAKASLD
ncbi:MAG: hypothetical protein K8H86_03195 [Ignavibacteriaceae bacterium]|nr:hypothetical protein [Ignavibacteriaceae bacterium]